MNMSAIKEFYHDAIMNDQLEAQHKILLSVFRIPGNKIKIRWSCSDFLHHEHRFQWTAMLCGWIQKKGAYWFYPKS